MHFAPRACYRSSRCVSSLRPQDFQQCLHALPCDDIEDYGDQGEEAAEAAARAHHAMKQAAEIMDMPAGGRGLPAQVAAMMGALGLMSTCDMRLAS